MQEVERGGRSSNQLVTLLAFYSNEPSSNLAEVYNFSINIVAEKNEYNQWWGRDWPI